jgi:L-alanine-DL-glutamate epimerase-like enolase superfamily enzyme
MAQGTAISAVRVEPLEAPLLEPFTIAIGRLDRLRNVLVTVELENGVIGYGEGAPLPPISGETQATVLAAVGDVQHRLIGRDAIDWRTIARDLLTVIHAQACARAALEMAVADAAAKSLRLPLWQLLGGAGRRISTDMSIPIVPAGHAGELARAAAVRGFAVLKVKVGEGLEPDLARVAAVAAQAPGCRITIDANQGFTPDQAIAHAAALLERGLPVDLFEQPVHRHDRDGLRQVREACGIPVAADESAWYAADVADLAARGAIDVVNLKLMKTGLAGGLDLVAMARSCRIGLMIGGMIETRLAMGCAAHLAAGQGDFRFVDLDTPLLLAVDPMEGGHRLDGCTYDLAPVVAGIGCWPTGRPPGFLP